MIKLGVWKKITLLAIVIFGLLGFFLAGLTIIEKSLINKYVSSGTSRDVFTAYDLVNASQVAGEDDIINIHADIDMKDVKDFLPFGLKASGTTVLSYLPFSGIIYGNGHTIRNLSIDFYATTSNQNFLGNVHLGFVSCLSGTVQDLRLENMKIHSKYFSNENNSYVSKDYMTTAGARGAIAGRLESTGKIFNCIIDGIEITETGNTSSKKSTASGVVGSVSYSGGEIDNIYLNNFKTDLSGYVLLDDTGGDVTIGEVLIKKDSGTIYKDDYSDSFYVKSNDGAIVYNNKQSAKSLESWEWYIPPTDEFNEGWPMLIRGYGYPHVEFFPMITYYIDTDGEVGEFDEYGDADGYEESMEIPFLYYFATHNGYNNFVYGEYKILEVEPTKNNSGTWSFYGQEIEVADTGEFQGWARETSADLKYYGDYNETFWSHNEYYKATITVPKYTITYNGVDNSVLKNPTEYDINTETFELKNPTPATGYTFDGWTGGCTGDFVTNSKKVTIEKGSTGNRLYAAKFTPITYTITYNLNGGTNNSKNPSSYNITTATITLQDPSKYRHEFTGWTGSSGTTPQKSVKITNGSTGAKTYTANWIQIEFDIVYDLDGGTLNWDTTRQVYSIYGTDYTLPQPTKPGYTFIGWTGSNGTTPQKSVTIDVSQGGNRTYEANWKNVYTVLVKVGGLSFDVIGEYAMISVSKNEQWLGNYVEYYLYGIENNSIVTFGSSQDGPYLSFTDCYGDVYKLEFYSHPAWYFDTLNYIGSGFTTQIHGNFFITENATLSYIIEVRDYNLEFN